MEETNENSILAAKPGASPLSKTTLGLEKAVPAEGTDREVPVEVSVEVAKKKKGRPKKVLSNEEIEFKKQIQEETEKAYKEVIETKVKKNIKRELKNKALEEGVKYQDPEPKAERPKRVLSAKQLENLAKGREIAIARTKNKKELHKKLDEDVKVIKEAKKSIRKTLLVDKIRDEIDGLDSDEEEQEIVIQKKPKVVKKAVLEEEVQPVAAPVAPTGRIVFY